MSEKNHTQREVTRIALAGIAQAGFALAGSGAIREHGVIDRPTEDVDLFTTMQDADEFARAVDRVVRDLRENGYEVEEVRRVEYFARLEVRAGGELQLDVDMGVDWRANDPVWLDIGPVLSVEDAVGNKISAVYSRGEPRDYLDVDAIRQWGRFTDEQLLTVAAARDDGFEMAMFAHQLEAVRQVTLLDVERYGIGAEQLEAVKARCLQWAVSVRGQSGGADRTGGG
ncbi:nucleotidyl transferase AbiEii/AbiGii toxin family protein [Actinomyces respiraculi]|uniref:nucleotidyl transferase AbiEii/AbiGii toxin family protein n=1 Tax=Actinomyces respiraculi TaxID=2744574 RepID=UPI00141EA8F9|nr:nucleotidyl transferase AbiEii/AbiGii toxin family protein [Actinomyces respiraculi]